MKKEIEITLLPHNIDNNDLIKKLVVKQLRISP